MTDSIPYTPRTERGNGLALPISKAIFHTMTVYTAQQRSWPMTVEEARAETEEAAQHLHDISAVNNLLSQEALDAVEEWYSQQDEILTQLRGLETENPDTLLSESNIAPSELKQFVQNGWAFLALIDKELTGIESDPGRVP